jgi:arginyl-tRNA synthetase
MNNLHNFISPYISQALEALYQEVPTFELQKTRKEFEGDITLAVFPIVKISKKSPENTAQEIGEKLQNLCEEVEGIQVVKGFLNIKMNSSYWVNEFEQIQKAENLLHDDKPKSSVMVEYSSPNTNKPLHLGHIRNCLLGYSISKIYEATGHPVVRVQIINDRGIHICKSMVAWLKYAEGETPESAGLKGDHLVGKYYVKFDTQYRQEVSELVAAGQSEEEAKKNAPILLEAREMLIKWEEKEPQIWALWEQMNRWVYAGFDTTYKKLGVDFHKNYYESDTYILGKKAVETGLNKEVFYQKEDGSVWIDLTDKKLDQKLLLRSDGTSVYMTQDLGTAIQRFEDYDIQGLIYTVGNEQDYHFQVLFAILEKLGYSWSSKLYHLSYGMVDLPTGRMKSREGTVVDADDLVDEMQAAAQKISEELGKLEGLATSEREKLYYDLGMGALKYFILKVDPKKRMTFNPEESIDFNGNTGPFIQYTHARIMSLLRKGKELNLENKQADYIPNDVEIELIKLMSTYKEAVYAALHSYNPSLIAQYVYELVKSYNGYYQQYSILSADNSATIQFRLELSRMTSQIIKQCLHMLGIAAPDRM